MWWLEQPRAWRPLLEGAQAARARALIERLAAQAAAAVGLGDDATLGTGQAGLALFLDELERAFPGAGHGELADRAIGHAVALVAEQPIGFGLFDGALGVALVLERWNDGGDGDDANAETDGLLAAELGGVAGVDLDSGLAGAGVYALARRARGGAPGLVEQVVERLDAAARRDLGAPGCAWVTPPEVLDPRDAARFPHGVVELGLAHGQAGVIAFLAQAGASASSLLDEAVAWVLAQLRRDDDPPMPDRVPVGASPVFGRTAWCRGDLGVAWALAMAARATQHASWGEAAVALSRAAARRAPSRTGVAHAMICHGAAGLAHVFARLGTGTGDEEALAAARCWLEEAMMLVEAVPIEQAGLLRGAAGIGLTLLSAQEPAAPAWDAAVLPGLPIRPGR